MNKIKLDIVDEDLYYEKLDNGLDVYIIRKEDFNLNYACFGTKFGGLDLEFIPINEKKFVKMPSGIAHFLEHKLFEQRDNTSAMDYYKKTGTTVNAYTNYKTTKYYFVGTENFKNNLLYLLDFVQDAYFTDENVEKEKGIILEEAYMTLDNPDRLFNEEIMKNLYNSIPYDKKVIGEIEDIKSITKEDLYRCYNTFYHPSNMHLLIVTNEDINEIIDLIKENQSKKNFKLTKIEKKEYIEDINVRKKKSIIKGNVMENRFCYSLKIPLSSFNVSKLEVYDYLSIMLGILIGNLSEFNIELKKDNIIKDDLIFRVSSDDTNNETYIIVKIYALTDNYKKVEELLDKELLKKELSKEDFELSKKSIISDLNYYFNSVSGIMNFMKIEYDFYGKIDNESIKIEKNLNYDNFIKVVNKFNLSNKSIVIMKGK